MRLAGHHLRRLAADPLISLIGRPPDWANRTESQLWPAAYGLAGAPLTKTIGAHSSGRGTATHRHCRPAAGPAGAALIRLRLQSEPQTSQSMQMTGARLIVVAAFESN